MNFIKENHNFSFYQLRLLMKILQRFYRWTHLATYLQSPLLFLIRLYWGVAFFLAGLSKFQDMQKFKALLTSLHIPQPIFNAFFVASIETVCGILLAIGFLSRLVTIPLIAVMCVAYATVHNESLKAFFTDPSKFVGESPFAFLFACLLILVFGPGKVAIDYFLVKDRA
ncbi:putative oxidoreductase CatD [Chlamydiales bacterium STE3]|nr:putative oxidoreductase CatD [Chlamydiales bacterium STE3]